jgi:hypothetical protein
MLENFVFQDSGTGILKTDGLKRTLPITADDYPMNETAGKSHLCPGFNI